MLVLTDNASTAVKSVTSDLAAAEAGLRIGTPEDSEQGFALAIVPAPEPADLVVESDGARVYLEAAVAEVLHNRALDAEVGSDGAVRFALRDQV